MAFSHSHAKRTLIAIISTIYIVFSINYAEAKHHHHRHDEDGDDEDFNIVWRRNVSLPNSPKGLDYTFYDNTCPDAEEIVRARVTFFVGQDPSIAPGLLRLFYHDCFIHGCDASVLLHGSVGGPWDGFSPPHISLNPQVFRVIDDIKSFLEARCPGVVSCADVIALAARDAVLAAKGPYFPIMTGRRDGFEIDTTVQVLSDLPKPTWRVSQLLSSFKSRGLDVVDLVALSGAHTIGKAHCASFMNRMAPKDDTMGEDIEETIKATCPTFSFNNTTYLDQTTPMQFDNKYFKNLVKREALLTSDDTLFHDFRTKELVKLFEQTRFLFYIQFGASMIRMGQIGVLTGSQGEIRINCFMRNPLPPLPSPAPAPAPSNSPSPSPSNSPSPSPTYPSRAPSPSPSPSRSVSPSASPYSPPPDAPPKPSMKSMGGLGWYVLFLVSIFGFVVFTAYYFKGKASDLDAALPSQTRLLS